eukprot:jgi/Tetstr1/448281/TSEL_035568.t1
MSSGTRHYLTVAGTRSPDSNTSPPRQPSASFALPLWPTWGAAAPSSSENIPQSSYFPDSQVSYELERELMFRALQQQRQRELLLCLAEGNQAARLPYLDRQEHAARPAMGAFPAQLARPRPPSLDSVADGSSVQEYAVGTKRRGREHETSPAPKANRVSTHSDVSTSLVGQQARQGGASSSQLVPLFRKTFNGVDPWTKIYIPRRVAEKNFPIVESGQECQLETVGFDGCMRMVTFRRDQRGDYAIKHAGSILRGSGPQQGDEVAFCMDATGRLALVLHKGQKNPVAASSSERVRNNLTPLFQKKLSRAEVRQHKVYLPKKDAVEHLPNLMAGESCSMTIVDVFDNVYKLQLQCRSLKIKNEVYRQFVLKGMSKLMSKYKMATGDTMTFALDPSDGALVVCGPEEGVAAAEN